jgi:hypothetical protein
MGQSRADGVDVGAGVAVDWSFPPALQPADEVRMTAIKATSTPSENRIFFNALPSSLY